MSDMSIVILGILTKTIVITLGLIGLLLDLAGVISHRRARLLPLPVGASSQFSSPVWLNTHRLISSPSRAPPEVTAPGLSARQRHEQS
jgi:hypothetical protein